MGPAQPVNGSRRIQVIYGIVLWVSLFLLMVLGMIAKSAYDYVESNERIDIGWSLLSRKDVLLPLIVSPIVFQGIYGLVRASPRNAEAFFFAFQNGFFWKTIFTESTSQFIK